jgi:hypothetical protein
VSCTLEGTAPGVAGLIALRSSIDFFCFAQSAHSPPLDWAPQAHLRRSHPALVITGVDVTGLASRVD